MLFAAALKCTPFVAFQFLFVVVIEFKPCDGAPGLRRLDTTKRLSPNERVFPFSVPYTNATIKSKRTLEEPDGAVRGQR